MTEQVQNPNADGYRLGRNYDASTRLTAQHFLWKSTLGFLLHPSIPELTPGAKVADVATGNGVWLWDLKQTAPQDIECFGFDISLDQCPHDRYLPKNFKFKEWDIMQDPPSELVGSFDVVHIRLITLVVTEDNPRPILERLKKLLKPGGYLQWEEVDSVDCCVRSPLRDLETLKVGAIGTILTQLQGTDTWKLRMKKILQDTGFSDVVEVKQEYDLSVGRYWNDLYMSTWNESRMKRAVDKTSVAQLSDEAELQVQEGSYIVCDKYVWVART